MKYELKSIGYWPLIKVSFLINLMAGFFFGLMFALFMGAFISMAEYFGPMAGMAEFPDELPPIGFMLLFYPFLFAIGGAIFYTGFSVVLAFIYNLIARLIGGLEFDLSQVQLQPVEQQTPQQQIYAQTSYSRPQPPPQQIVRQTPTVPPPPPPPPPIQPLPPDIKPPPEKGSREDGGEPFPPQ